MYKIYINDRPLVLDSTNSREKYMNTSDGRLVSRYSGKVKTLLHYADLLEKESPRVTSVVLYAEDLDNLWKDFQSHYQLLEAAGGLVRQPDGRWLLIFRRGHWDLPKGKVDPGEELAEAALREVREETGLEEVHLIAPLTKTFHTYRSREGRRILKPTHWYLMESSQQKLIAQTEEDIEQAVWVTPEEALNSCSPKYSNIRDVLNLAVESKKSQ